MSGKKFDDGKPPMQLIPHRAMVEVARVLAFGAKKYDAHNWRKGIAFSRLIGACERHLGAFKDGEDLDKETQLSHIAHLICEGIFLMQFLCEERTDLDDRYRPSGVVDVPRTAIELERKGGK